MITEPAVRSYLSEHYAAEDFATLDGYVARGGFAGLRAALRPSREQLLATIEASGLRGRGGAGFPTGSKWRFMAGDDKREKLLVANADESEPGSFKDRAILERAPFQLIEGLLIAARATGAKRSYVYVRGEYAEAAQTLERAVHEARAAGWLGGRVAGRRGFRHDVIVHRGAGAYICGEETALLESLEGRKGLPRKKPPYPAERGAFALPTTVNNVETLAHVPFIVARGAEWFRGFGTEKSPGTTLFGVSGHVERPGLFELPLGTPLSELLGHAGGVRGARALKGIIPGGVSMPILPASDLDVGLDEESLAQRGSHLGTGGVIVMDEGTCMVRVACAIAEFFREESCGQCTQCREGTGWIHKLVTRIERGGGTPQDLEVLESLPDMIEGQTICSFADAAVWPIRGLLRHFAREFRAHVDTGKCPFPGSFALP